MSASASWLAAEAEKKWSVVKSESSIRTIAFVGNYEPRKCGISTFTFGLLQAVAARHPRSRCFAVPVNDHDLSYRYPDVGRFEIEEQHLESYRRAEFLNSSNVDIVSVQPLTCSAA